MDDLTGSMSLVAGGAERGCPSKTAPEASRRTAEPACTVVVCTRNRPDELAECLAALSRQTYSNYTVLVVDNAPDEPVASVCSRWGATYMRDPVAGVSRARNSGARAADGEIIAFTDDDALPEPGWLAALVAEFADPRVMAVTGRVRYLRNTAEGRMRGGETTSAEWRSRPRRGFDRAMPNWLARACFGGIGDGCNMAFRRRAFDAWPGFDERLGRGRPIDGGEEHLAFMSLIDRGYRVVYTPAAVIKHPYPHSPSQLRARRIANLRSLVAYACLLWAEFPQHRRALARHLIGSALGIRSIRWRPGRSIGVFRYGWAWMAALAGVRAFVHRSQPRARRGMSISSSLAGKLSNNPAE